MCNCGFCRGLSFLNNSDWACFILCFGTGTAYDSFLSHASCSKETTCILQRNKVREVHFKSNTKQSSRIFIHSVEVSSCIIKQAWGKNESLAQMCSTFAVGSSVLPEEWSW